MKYLAALLLAFFHTSATPSTCLYLVFSALLVVVGGLQAWLLWGTMRATRDNAKAASDNGRAAKEGAEAAKASAEAASKNAEFSKLNAEATNDNAAAAKSSADALINSERAWVMADIRGTPDLPHAPVSIKLNVIEGSGTDGDTLWTEIYLLCKNDGKTPAWIIERRVLFRIVDVLPIPPDFEISITGDFILIGPAPLKVGQNDTIRATLQCRGRREMGKFLVIYGYIKYRDIFSPDERETRFGYKITDDYRLERISGSGDFWQYNSYT